MRSLLVAHNLPWPSYGGGLLRLAQVVETVAGVSDLDLFVLGDQKESRIGLPQSISVNRSTGTPYPRMASQLRWRLEWAAHRGLPLEVVMARSDHGPRRALREWAKPPYDVVWFSTAEVYEWVGRPNFGPSVVDLMDLQDIKAELRVELLAAQLESIELRRSLRTRLAWYQARLNRNDWRRFQRSVATRVATITVPSELDAVRSNLPNATVIPNTYPRPPQPLGNPSAQKSPVVLFQGTLEYPPNIDGAEWLATSITPRIRRQVRTAEVRLVGQPATSVLRLHQPPAVTVVGRVQSMDEELARASVAVVPVRYGGGTRIKILESFAHRVPVVSTTIGAEGLDVEDGVHLLLADDAAAFADATVRLLLDGRLRMRLTEAAEVLYQERYDGRVADEAVRRLIRDVARPATRS
jgi:hypothetical protein